MKDEIDILLDEYVETFHCNFPYFIHRLNDEDLSKALKTCLKEGKPYDELFFTNEDRRRIADPNIVF